MKKVQIFTVIDGSLARFDTDCPSENAHLWVADLRAEVAASEDGKKRTSPVLALIFGGKDV